MQSRRDLLKFVAATLTAWLLPHRLLATTAALRFHFLQIETLTSWPVADPVTWALQNQGEPVLERAAEGLAKLTPDDGDRIIRVVVRRCRLNLLELHPGQVVVQYWASHRADLRPFFKQHRLVHPQIEVVLRDRKKETITTQHGDDFLFGARLAPDFPLDLFMSKWAGRFERQPDDWSAAPGTWSGYTWEGVEDNRIPWAALKSAWRRAAPLICLNCDTPTILVNFGYPWVSMFNRSPRFVSHCGVCRRSFVDDSITDVWAWIVASLDTEVRPDAEMVWGKRVKLEPKA